MKKLVSLILIGIALGCSPKGIQEDIKNVHPLPVNYVANDNQSARRIDISYTNNNDAAVCLGAENWPSNGILLNDGNEIYITVDNKRYYLKSEQDYCPKCSSRVAPGESLSGYLKYESFSLPDEVVSSTKRLSFRPVAFTCP